MASGARIITFGNGNFENPETARASVESCLPKLPGFRVLAFGSCKP